MDNSSSSVLELQKLLRDGEITKEEYHRKALDQFTKGLDVKLFGVIGRGSFSTVLEVWKGNDTRSFALRIVLKEDVGPKEREWGKLHHKNILTLIAIEEDPEFELTWFQCPVVEMTLENVLHRKVYQNNPKAFEVSVSWIRDTTSALDYMHNEGLSFLNLKLSNLMICRDQSLKLFGFHRMIEIGRLTTGYDVPGEYVPPESYYADDRRFPVEGKSFDLWCLGILTTEVFTGNSLSRNKPDEIRCWSIDIYPRLFNILKKKNFNKECRRAFPNSKIKNKTLKYIRNFARACLRFSPNSRTSTGTLLQHNLLEKRGLQVEKDEIWKKQLKSIAIKQKIKTMKFPTSTEKSVVCQSSVYESNASHKIDNVDHIADDKIKNISENEVTKERNVHDLTTVDNKDKEKTNTETENALEYEVMREEKIYDISSIYTDNESNAPCKIINADHTEDDKIKNISKNEVIKERNVYDSVIVNGKDKEKTYIEVKSASEYEVTREEEIHDIISIHTDNETNCDTDIVSDRLSFQEIFSRVMEYCQDNLIRRLLRKESLVKPLMNDSKAGGDVMRRTNSSRVNSLGYKVASKIFQFFI